MCIVELVKNTFSNFYDIKKISDGGEKPQFGNNTHPSFANSWPPTQHNQLILLVIGQEISTTFNPEHK